MSDLLTVCLHVRHIGLAGETRGPRRPVWGRGIEDGEGCLLALVEEDIEGEASEAVMFRSRHII